MDANRPYQTSTGIVEPVEVAIEGSTSWSWLRRLKAPSALNFSPHSEGRPRKAHRAVHTESFAFRASKAFASAINQAVSAKGAGLLVFVEGETDPKYLHAAARALGKGALLERVVIEWIGAKDDQGRVYHTGKGALNAAALMLKAKPTLVQRPVLLLFDSDARKPEEDFGSVSIRSLPVNESNGRIRAGIENLLPEAAITDDMFTTDEKSKPDGTVTKIRSLHKTKLCDHVCFDPTPANFAAFESVFAMIESLAK